jgi:hypothetical protein
MLSPAYASMMAQRMRLPAFAMRERLLADIKVA